MMRTPFLFALSAGALLMCGCASASATDDGTEATQDELSVAGLAPKPIVARQLQISGGKFRPDSTNLQFAANAAAVSVAPNGAALSDVHVDLIQANYQMGILNHVVSDAHAKARFDGSKLVVTTGTNETFTVDGASLTYSGAASLPSGYPALSELALTSALVDTENWLTVDLDFANVQAHTRLSKRCSKSGCTKRESKHVGDDKLALECDHYPASSTTVCNVLASGGFVAKTPDGRWMIQSELAGARASALFHSLPALEAALHGVRTPEGSVVCGTRGAAHACLALVKSAN